MVPQIMRGVVAAAAIVLLAAGCTRSGESATGEHAFTRPGELRVEIAEIPKNLNPIYTTTTYETFLASLAFDHLVTVDPKGHDVPDLAAVVPSTDNGGISADGKTITYRLRKGVRWHDGAPFSSADVKFSWQAVMNANNNVISRRGYDDVAGVDTPDSTTVVFHLKTPFAPFVDTVFAASDYPFFIIPQHVLAKYPNLNNVPFNAQPVGTGPFRIVRWDRGDHIEYAANPNYFRGTPHLQRIVVHFVTDPNTMTSDMRAHATDMATEITADAYHALHGEPSVTEVLASSPQYLGVAFNMLHPPLNDLRVRQALSAAIDAQAIISHEMFDTAQPATEDLPSYYWAYDPNVTPKHPFDLERAKALLESAGWKLGSDGIRVRDGKRLELVLAFDHASYGRVAVELQSQLRAAGADAIVKPYEAAQLYAAPAAGGILTGGHYDLALSPWVAGADPDDSEQWMCQYRPPAGYGITGFCNSEMDARERTALTHFDRGTRLAAYKRTQAILAETVPEDFMLYQPFRYAINPDLKNFQPDGVEENWNAADWSI